MAKMLWFKDVDINTAFFHAVVKRRNNSSGIHCLRIDNKVIEDPKLIEDHILDFYKNLYAEFISNVQDTSNMEDFIGTYIPELISSKENTIFFLNVLIFWKSRMLFLILIVIVLLVLMVLVVFSIILVGKLFGQMFAMLFNSFLNKTGFFLK